MSKILRVNMTDVKASFEEGGSSCAMSPFPLTTRSGMFPTRRWTASGIFRPATGADAGVGSPANPRPSCGENMIDIYLYGKLRRFARDRDPIGLSIVGLEVKNGDTIKAVLMRLGIPMEEVGSNIFLNGQYSDLARKVKDGDRLAIFPDDMQLLYRWYFNKVGPDDDVPA